MNKPNILMIITDQEYAHQSFPVGATLPNRDRLRAQGVTFNNQHATTTVCTPSRSVMWTGQHTPHTGMIDNTNLAYIENMRVDPDTLPTIGHLLRDQGYYTAYKGKWHESEIPDGDTTNAMEPYGFSDFQEWGDVHSGPLDGFKLDPKVATESADWLNTKGVDAANQEQPWFLAVNFVNPHDIMYFDTDDDEEQVQQSGMFPIFSEPDTPLYKQRWQTTLPASFFDDLEDQPQAVRNYKTFNDMAYGKIPMARRDMWHNHINYYINCHIDVDRHIGTVLDALEKSGQADNTVIIFTADHGEMAGAHHLRQKGSVAFKEIVNVPMIIAAPGQPRGVRTDAVGSHLDLVPTALAYAGLSEDERKQRYPFLKGHDLSAVVADPTADGPRGSSQNPGKGALMTYDMLYSVDVEWLMGNAPKLMDVAAKKAGVEFKRGREAFQPVLEEIGAPDSKKRELFRGIFDGRYKLVRHFGLGGFNLPQTVDELLSNNDVALYDLKLDPEEMNNLANRDNPDFDETLLASMNSKLNTLITAEIGDDQFLFDEEKLERLQREP